MMSRRSMSAISAHALADRVQAVAPLAVQLRRARRAEQLGLQAVERDRQLALGRHLLDQPVGRARRPTRPGSKSAPASRSAIAAMRSTSRRAVQCRAASRMSALVAKCHVVEDSETFASAATPRWVTAPTPSRATTRTVAATIDSRTRWEACARTPVTPQRLQVRSYLHNRVHTYYIPPRPCPDRYPPDARSLGPQVAWRCCARSAARRSTSRRATG